MKGKLIGGIMMGMLLCVGVSNVAEAQWGRRSGVSVSLNVGVPVGVGYVAAGPAYCPPPPAYYPPAPVVYQQVYRRPHCRPRYYAGPACGGAPVVYNNYYHNGYGGHNGHGYGHAYGHNGPRGHR